MTVSASQLRRERAERIAALKAAGKWRPKMRSSRSDVQHVIDLAVHVEHRLEKPAVDREWAYREQNAAPGPLSLIVAT